MRNFTVYSKDGCPYCQQILEVLGISELNYVEYKLGEDFTKEAFYGQFGEGATFPQVVLNNDNLGGCQESIRYMQKEKICCV
jgi:glutaredoxin|tara:strand:+ start:258 stop:503 length:246 start_codon:yes stop_codon:yes gene_type:complete